jgi:hypothetical protein
VYNKIARFDQPFWDHRSKTNDFFWQKTPRIPARSTQIEKDEPGNLHASQNDENNIVGFDALAGGLKELRMLEVRYADIW